MRILAFASFPPPHTGQNVATATYCDLLRNSACVDFVNTSDATAMTRSRGGLLAETRYLYLYFCKLMEMRSRLRTGHYDALYMVFSSSVMGRYRDALCIAIARRHVPRIAGHVHVGNFAESVRRLGARWVTGQAFGKVDHFFFLSESLAAPARHLLAKSDIALVPNTVSAEMDVGVQRVRQKISAARRRGSLNIVFLANMIPSKGYHLVAQGLRHYQRRCKVDGRLRRVGRAHFVGAWPTGSARQEFMALLRSLDLECTCLVPGAIGDRSQVRDILMDADLIILPTAYPCEAQPLSIIEALALAVPAIVANHASLPDYINHQNGVILAERTPEAIGQAIEHLQDPERWSSCAEAARRTFEERFSRDVVRRSLLEAIGQPAVKTQ